MARESIPTRIQAQWLSFAAVVALAACGGGGGDGDAPVGTGAPAPAPAPAPPASGPAPTPAPAPAPTPAPPPAGLGVGSAGGIVTGPYSAQLSVPAGALSATVDLQVARDGSGAPALPATGLDTAGAPYALTPHGTSFAVAATVSIPFDATRIPTDADPVLYKAEPGGAFAPITTSVDNGMLVADVSGLSWVIPGYASTQPRVVYALTRGSSGFQVSSFRITRGSGALSTATSSAPTGDIPISVTVHPSRRFAYVSNAGVSTVNGVAPASIAVYRLDPVSGEISGPIDSKQVGGTPLTPVVHPTGAFVYVVNEASSGSSPGSVSVFSIDATTGALSAPVTTADSGGAPATSIAFSPSGEFAYVTYLFGGSTPSNNSYWDTVKAFSVDHATGQLVGPISSAGTGDDPWSMVITPDGNYAYVASLSNQGSVDELSTYALNAQTGAVTFRNTMSVQSQPGSLAMDPEGRFLYIGKQKPFFNQNLLVYSIDSGNGGLTFASAVLLGSGPEVGPIAVAADPQGQFVYATDFNNADIVSFSVSATGQLTPTGTGVAGVFSGGGSLGVGDPFSFAVSGTSPVWEDGCTIMTNAGFVFDGCAFIVRGSTGGGGGPGGGGTTPPPPAATHRLDVTIGTWGGSIVSSPAGIDYSLDDLSRNKSAAAFSTGSAVELCGSPPPETGQAYDISWTGTGGCGGTATCTTVTVSVDRACRLEWTPRSP